MNKLLSTIQSQLDIASNQKSKIWWENYLKHSANFRGFGLPQVKEVLKANLDEIQRLSKAQLKAFLYSLFAQEYTEDKLLSILYLQYYSQEKFNLDEVYFLLEKVFDNQLITDWNVCDWLCVRVLKTLVSQDKRLAKKILNWSKEEYLWKARAGVVSFVGDVEFMQEQVLDACRTLIEREEKFSKTAVGWYLRELSKKDENKVKNFIATYKKYITTEVKRNALKYSR